MKALGTAHHREVEAGGVPDHIVGSNGKTFSNMGRERMGHWRGARVEVVGCGRIGGVDAASRWCHQEQVVLFAPGSLIVDP